jgi:hypothetical protein
MQRNQVLEKEEKEIIELYLTGKTLKYVASSFNRNRLTISNILKRKGITKHNRSTLLSKYVKNNIFIDLNSEECMYYLGLLYADGSISSYQASVVLKLTESEKHLVEDFAYRIYGFNKTLGVQKPANKNQNYAYYISVCSDEIYRRLIELGCVPAKSLILTFPKFLSIESAHHFIRGYFDGDGCAHNYSPAIDIMGSHLFIDELYSFLVKSGITGRIVHKTKKMNLLNKRFWITRQKEFIKFYNYIYRDATIFSHRKKDILTNWKIKIENGETVHKNTKNNL